MLQVSDDQGVIEAVIAENADRSTSLGREFGFINSQICSIGCLCRAYIPSEPGGIGGSLIHVLDESISRIFASKEREAGKKLRIHCNPS